MTSQNRVVLATLLAIGASGALVHAAHGQGRAWVTNNRTILGSPDDLTASVEFVDVDADGDIDIVYANGRHWAQLNEVYLNNGRAPVHRGLCVRPGESDDVRRPGERSR